MFLRNLRRGSLPTLFVLSILIRGVLSQNEPCTVRDDGKYYDLSQLKSSKDFQITTDTGRVIYLNVCQNVKTEMFGLKDDIQESDVGGFIRRAHGDFAFGMVNTTLTVRDSRPRFILSGGSYCKAKADDVPGEMRASALVEFTCDKSILGPGQPRLVAQLPPGDDEEACAWVIEWRTHFACPSSEGRGIWDFFAILAVIFLVLLMTYAVLGTVYNRYVLQLRGVDQIPQFSIESMRYHSSEALDWIKDLITGLNISGRRSGGTPYGGSPSAGLPSGSLQTPNPVSHHSQTSGSGSPGDLEGNGGPDKSGGGRFFRPQQSKSRAAPFQRLETNPVSHQSQVIAQSLSYSAATSPPPSQFQHHTHDLPPQGRRSATDRRGSTKEERDFMLDDDEDAEELADVSTPVAHTSTSRISPPLEAASNSGTTASDANVASVARGDLGSREHVHL